MKKCDFKKLVITGIASGAILATQAGNADNAQDNKEEKGSYLLAAGGCGAGSCATQSNTNPPKPQTPSKYNNNTNQNTQQPSDANTNANGDDSDDVSDNSTRTQNRGSCAAKATAVLEKIALTMRQEAAAVQRKATADKLF